MKRLTVALLLAGCTAQAPDAGSWDGGGLVIACFRSDYCVECTSPEDHTCVDCTGGVLRCELDSPIGHCFGPQVPCPPPFNRDAGPNPYDASR
ncbi:MAG: hypothetical protein K8H88_16630 [Sandaracinaceae bacterium]|nr:hypothetical protein [Sandaracinaceae bacterium]